MKVLHIIDHMGLGGAQSMVKRILKEEDNLVYSLRIKKKEKKIEKVIYNNSFNKLSFPIYKLKKLIKKEKVSILHCHLTKSLVVGVALKKLFFPNIALIFHEHGNIFDKGKVYPIILRKSQKNIDKILAVSDYTKKELIRKSKISEDKIVVIYNFIDLDKFNRKNIRFNISEERKKLGLLDKDFVVGFAGRLIKSKGWEDLISLAKLIQNKKIKFLVAGDGEDKDKFLNKLEKLNLKEKVIYLGKLTEMKRFYSLIDLFYMPTYRESMGLTQLEAQAMQVPVIVYNIPGLNETISNKNAILIRKGNITESLDKINELISNKNKLNKLKKEGLSNSKRYSFELFRKKLIDLYKNYE